jgi:hypothetical protein
VKKTKTGLNSLKNRIKTLKQKLLFTPLCPPAKNAASRLQTVPYCNENTTLEENILMA